MDLNKQKSKISYQPMKNCKILCTICNKNILKNYLMDIQLCRKVKKLKKWKYYMQLEEFKDFSGDKVLKKKSLK